MGICLQDLVKRHIVMSYHQLPIKATNLGQTTPCLHKPACPISCLLLLEWPNWRTVSHSNLLSAIIGVILVPLLLLLTFPLLPNSVPHPKIFLAANVSYMPSSQNHKLQLTTYNPGGLQQPTTRFVCFWITRCSCSTFPSLTVISHIVTDFVPRGLHQQPTFLCWA
jgi:hypothetical protein